MMTPAKKAANRRALNEFEQIARENAFTGSMRDEDAEEIEAAYEKARRRIERLLGLKETNKD